MNEEDGNEHDPYAVRVLKNEMTVDVPREVSRLFGTWWDNKLRNNRPS